MRPFDDGRLAVALSAATETERAVRFHLETETGPIELARGWEAYRGAVALRKALDKWVETRRLRAAQTGEGESGHAERA